ncbi:hypothetical protein L9F63_022516 [Diploptera punctata]|uniref:G-protein coupled receptors family 3 profile domain-containing protein n=1 Tax=Diploptera punctata TaxID=6984 RepID=A0AAD8EAZ4_DIPPU|nr:hypothetical protein L9F63_022516 [Diploptera punctata]
MEWRMESLGRHFGILLALLVVSANSSSLQNVSIGILIDLRVPGNVPCRLLNLPAAQYVFAAKWAAEVINNQSSSQGISLGIELLDTCGARDMAVRDVFFAIKSALEPRGKLPLLGLIGMGDPEDVGETVAMLHAFNIPLILASPKLADSVTQQGNILTTAPDMSGLVAPVLVVAQQLRITRLSLISDCSHSIAKFKQIAKQMGIHSDRLLNLTKHSKNSGDMVKKFLEGSVNNETIVLILDPEEIYSIAQHLRNYKFNNNILLTGAIGLDKNLLKLWKNIFTGGYLIEPQMPELPDFTAYLINQIQCAGSSSDELLQNYVEKVYHCSWSWKQEPSSTRDCATLTQAEISTGLQLAPEVTFVVKAVSAFSAAVFLVQAEQCLGRNLTECSRISNINLHQEILHTLSKLSFKSQHKTPLELQGTSLHVTQQGQLVSNKYVIFHIRENGDVTGVGWYSDDEGLVLDNNPIQTAHNGGKFVNEDKLTKVTSSEEQTVSDVNARRVMPDNLVLQPWATLLIAVAAVGMCIAMFMLTYVLIKMCDGTLTGNQSLGIILLLGIMTLYASITLFVLPASETRCTLRTILHPVALSLCYGILIIKVMQLRSLVLLGLGGRISYINQYIILFFIILVQIVINTQWLITNRPHYRVDSEGFPYCYMPRTDFLLLHLYVTILVIIAFLYGLSVLDIKRNHKEGHWVTLAAFLTMPALVIWGLLYSFIPEEYNEPIVCVALIILASILILVLFLPKMSTISKQNSHFKHKKIQMSDSVTTVFTPRQLSVLDAYSDNITKNPIYHVAP